MPAPQSPDRPGPDDTGDMPATILVDADACPVKDEIYRVAERHGARFACPALLRDMAAKDQTFYGRFGQQKQAA